MFCGPPSGSKLFAKVISRRQKLLIVGKDLKYCCTHKAISTKISCYRHRGKMKVRNPTWSYVSFLSFININPMCTGNPKRGSLANSEDPGAMPQMLHFIRACNVCLDKYYLQGHV